MTKRMLIDATQKEETRVAVVEGQHLAEFDYESKVRKQLKGTIFLAKVTRVEPSLQAAFVNFGGNRHGFLPFSEIHPDYFRIPVADREALKAAENQALAQHDQEHSEAEAEEEAESEDLENEDSDLEDQDDDVVELGGEDQPLKEEDTESEEETEALDDSEEETSEEEEDSTDQQEGEHKGKRQNRRGRGRYRGRRRGRYAAARSKQYEIVGGDEPEYEDDDNPKPFRFNLRRQYKIQEVIKRGQIMLIQISKEERGNKGAAATTYLSLPGRYCVLMPNSPRAGGVSRKIANHKDRKRMREILSELNLPEGMSVILRTAGVSRTKSEIKRDLDYLLRLWNNIRELTLQSTAPAVINEEGNLIKRSIRDLYTRDIEEVMVEGENGYKTAKDIMKMMIPSHAKRVKEYKDKSASVFQKYSVEKQITEIGEPTAKLKSGGYLVINPTEALVSIDVNSGRATKERHIEETALKTNLEAATEVARQMRLRDLAGLVVIDFIDMEDRRNNRKVEKRLREALSQDRARIQVGRISSFGLLELSRQRLNPSLTESQFQQCPTCKGIGHIRTIDSAVIIAIRALEEEVMRESAAGNVIGEATLSVPNEMALYILNNKRRSLLNVEERYDIKINIHVDDELETSAYNVTLRRKEKEIDAEDEPEESSDNSSDHQEQGNNSQKKRGNRNDRGRNRRGRRDNRNQRDDDSKQDKNEEQQESGNQESSNDDPQKSDEKESKPKKSPRRRKKKEDEAPESRSDNKNLDRETPDEKSSEDQKEEKPKRKPARKKQAKAGEEKAEESKAPEEEKTSAARPEKAEKPQREPEPVDASNDDTPKDYETVNQAPKKKKKGWWNKLVEQN